MTRNAPCVGDNPPPLRLSQLARLAGISRQAIYAQRRNGRLATYARARPGQERGVLLVPCTEAQRWLREREMRKGPRWGARASCE